MSRAVSIPNGRVHGQGVSVLALSSLPTAKKPLFACPGSEAKVYMR